MRPSLKLRFIAAALLLVYLISGTSVLPATLAIAAAFDQGHHLVVGHSERGLELTLEHATHGCTRAVRDHRDPLTRLVVSFCASSSNGDHQFSTPEVEANLTTERDDAARAAKQTPCLNAQATEDLSQTSRLRRAATVPSESNPLYVRRAATPAIAALRLRASTQLQV